MDIPTQTMPTTADTEPQYLDNLAIRNKDGGDFIRLLRVLAPSSRPREATLCELKVFSLDLAPRYSALSYCRQPDVGLVTIDVRRSLKAAFPITHDLRSAIRSLTRHRQTTWFWIDALCINEDSTEEKNDQVPRMRIIFEKACAGRIWLGNPVPRNDKDLEDNRSESISKRLYRESLGSTHSKLLQLAKLDKKKRSWWCRTWIIQEMILPARLYVCVGVQMMR